MLKELCLILPCLIAMDSTRYGYFTLDIFTETKQAIYPFRRLLTSSRITLEKVESETIASLPLFKTALESTTQTSLRLLSKCDFCFNSL